MKKFKFYALAFAAIAFAGCSDDVIDGQGASGTQGDGTPAYLTISFTANGGNSSRSTADDANNNGDEHNQSGTTGQEDSGHHSEGINGESEIDEILLVVAPASAGSNAKGTAKIYTALDQDDEGFANADADDFVQTAQATKTYKNAEPIELSTGEYKVLVVINPVDKLLGTDNANLADPSALYNTIVNGDYSYTAVTGYDDNYVNAANSIGMGLGYDGTNATNAAFMMANKAEAPVTLDQYDTPENPATVDIEVERVLSKITFRSTTPTNGAENVYPVDVKLGTAPAISMEGAVAKENQADQYDIKTLNKGTDLKNQEIWGEYDTNGKLIAAYKIVYKEDNKTAETVNVNSKDYTLLSKVTITTQAAYDALEEESKKEEDYCFVTDTNNPKIELEYDTNAEITEEHWFVKLEGYALVNLSKSVNYVRHTVTGGAMVPFGVLNGSNYLWTPNWDEKNGVTFVEDENGDLQFPTGTNPGAWFYNTLEEVSGESANLKINTTGNDRFSLPTGDVQYFKTFDSMYDDGSTVTGSDHYTEAPTLPAVGKLMSYCFENSTDVAHQTHGLSTGISFVATIWKNKECTEAIDKLYLYQGHNFTTIQQIRDVYGSNILQGLDESSTKEELEAAGVKLYNSNICYYYTTEIKHFDNNNDQDLGNMEFAIMRNNIYSLSVSTITQIGDPIVDPTPSIPNESEEAALDVQVTMLPWIVRYNDIEF